MTEAVRALPIKKLSPIAIKGNFSTHTLDEEEDSDEELGGGGGGRGDLLYGAGGVIPVVGFSELITVLLDNSLHINFLFHFFSHFMTRLLKLSLTSPTELKLFLLMQEFRHSSCPIQNSPCRATSTSSAGTLDWTPSGSDAQLTGRKRLL